MTSSAPTGAVRLEWFPLHAAALDALIRGWPAAAVGCYLRLLLIQWVRGAVPADPERLRAICSPVEDWSEAWAELEPLFPIGDDGMRRNPELEQLREEQLEKRQRRAEAGRRGGFGKAAALPRQSSSNASGSPQRNPASRGEERREEKKPLPAASGGDLRFPCPNGKTWSPSAEQLAEWSATHPRLDVDRELREALSKARTCGEERAPATWPKYLAGWLRREAKSANGADAQRVPLEQPDEYSAILFGGKPS